MNITWRYAIHRRTVMVSAVIVLLLGNLTALQAQPAMPLSLTEALDLAQKQNYDRRIAVANEDGAKAERAKSNAVFLPSVSLSQSYVATSDPLNAFGFKLKQKITQQSDFNPATLNNPDVARNFQTRLDIQQPLFNPDMFFGRLAAEHQVSVAELKLQRTDYAVQLGVRQSYFQLALAEEAFQVTERAVKAAEANRDLAKNFSDKGMISIADVMLAQVHLLDMQSKKAEADLARVKASEQLALTLGLPAETKLTATDSLRLMMPVKSLDSLRFSTIEASRTDLKAMSAAVAAAENMATMNVLSFVPRINAFGSYELNDPKFLGFHANNWTLGLALKWDIFKGYQDVSGIQKSRADVAAARAQSEKYSRQSSMEFTTARKGYETIRKKMELSDETLKQTTQYLRIINDRFSKGMEKTSDVLNAEAAYYNVRLQHLQTLFEHNLALFQLEYLTEQSLTIQ